MAQQMAGDRLKLYWFEGRSTPAVAPSAQAARDKGVAGSRGRIVASRAPTEAEQRKIESGTWIRARPPGTEQRSDAGPSRYRPQLRQQAKGRSVD